MKTGIELIAAERERQITAEGWTAAHDDEHSLGEIAQAASVYAIASQCVGRTTSLETIKEQIMETGCEPMWPWEPAWLKLSDDPIRNLVKAGALIAAEIDRLQRAAAISLLDEPRPHARHTDAYPDGCECEKCGEWDRAQALNQNGGEG